MAACTPSPNDSCTSHYTRSPHSQPSVSATTNEMAIYPPDPLSSIEQKWHLHVISFQSGSCKRIIQCLLSTRSSVSSTQNEGTPIILPSLPCNPLIGLGPMMEMYVLSNAILWHRWRWTMCLLDRHIVIFLALFGNRLVCVPCPYTTTTTCIEVHMVWIMAGSFSNIE